jgi:hypothetical protein
MAPLIRDGREQRFGKGTRMDRRNIGQGGAWRLATHQRGEIFLG